MNKPHKHATLIKLWADGAQIEFRFSGQSRWHPLDDDPVWLQDNKYRVATERPPEEVWANVYPEHIGAMYKSKAEAQKSAGPNCIGTFRYVLAEDQG